MFRFNPFKVSPVPLSVKKRLDKKLSVRRRESVGISLLLLIDEHWLAKTELKKIAVPLKAVINLSCGNIGCKGLSYQLRSFSELSSKILGRYLDQLTSQHS